MSELIVEVHNGDGWKLAGIMTDVGEAGLISHNPEGADREIWRFRNLGDRSIIERAPAGIDFEIGSLRALLHLNQTEAWTTLAEVRDGSPWETKIQTDNMKFALPIRFTHHA